MKTNPEAIRHVYGSFVCGTGSLMRWLRASVLGILLAGSALAGTSQPPPVEEKAEPSAFEKWWNGKYASGNWVGLRDQLEDRGINISGRWKGTFYGIVDGGLDSPRGAFDEEIELRLTLDFGKLAAIDGLTATGAARWRDGRNPNTYVGASNAFSPSRFQSGQQWRLMPFYLTYTTPEVFGIKEFFTISGGWQNAYDHFADQPESKLFTNNAIGTSKGIGANGVPWSSSYAAWGGYNKVRPIEWHYIQLGLYEAIPNATALSNHGLYFEGFTPDRSLNGLYFVGETGITPKIGPSNLPGKYAFGAYYFGVENRSFFRQTYDGRYGFYWQADQMLYREPSAEEPAQPAKGSSSAKSPADGKRFSSQKEAVAPKKPALSDQGLYWFSFFNYAPKYNNVMPFYFHTGFVYKGLIPARDKDQFGVAFALGNYSYYKILAEKNAGRTIHQTYEALVEIDYRIQLTRFFYAQPFWQYIIRPNGNGLVENATILGFQLGANF